TTAPGRRRARTGTARPLRCGRARTARRRPLSEARVRKPRWAAPPGHAPLVARESRLALPPDGALHRLRDILRVPEVGGEVLPPAVGEHRDDDALVELLCEPARDVDDRTGGDAGEDSLLVQQRTHGDERLLVRHEHLPVALR